MDAHEQFMKAMGAMIERSNVLTEMLDASMTGEGVMVRVIDDQIIAERVTLDDKKARPRR